MRLLGSTKASINKTKNGKNISGTTAVKVVLGQNNLVDNQYKKKSEALYTFTPNRFCP